MAITLDRIDSAPILNNDFDSQFSQWLWVLIDTLNENLTDIQNALNVLSASNYTAAQISNLYTAGILPDGIVLYDTTNNEYVGKISGTLVKFTTAAYP
jgi:hypothetical protein